MPLSPQEQLDLLIEDDLKHRHPVKHTEQRLHELGCSSLVDPYITWRKWDRYRDALNSWRRTKRFLRQFLAIRPTALAFLITLVVLAFHLPATRPTALSWGEVIRDLVTVERALWAGVGLVALVVAHRLLRIAVEAWELRHSADVRLIEDSFITDSGIAVKVPHKVYMAMTRGGGSRLARIAYSTNLYSIFPSRTSLGKQDELDHSLRTPRAMHLMERWREREEQKKARE